jgi:hypothetical protein
VGDDSSNWSQQTMDDSLKHLRLILAQILFHIRSTVVNDYVSASEPIVASNADFDNWVTRIVPKLDAAGASPDPSAKHPNGGLKPLYDLLLEDELGYIEDLKTTATWWAAAEAAAKGRTDEHQLAALASAMWHLKRARDIGQAENAGEGAGVWFWEAAKELTNAVADAAKGF